MLSFFKIWTVAYYEIKTLMRSWFFRIFSLLTFTILVLLNVSLFSTRFSPWILRGVPSSIPYLNLMFLNIVQAIIGIFMASDFLKYDKKLDSTEVIYMRSMTNADYVLGKSLGVFVLFFILNVLILIVALVFNVFFADVQVVLSSYLYYPLLISMPTLVFVFGLSFFCMVLIRSQAVTFIILLGYIASTLFFLGHKFHYLFDYMAINVPLMYSDFIGFGNIYTILIHRGIYLFLGLGFIFTTILLLKRLPQSRIINRFSLILAIIFIVVAATLGNIYLSTIFSGKELRLQMTALNKQLADEPKISITDLNIDLTHQGKEIEVKADIQFANNTTSTIDKYILSLNPGLEIQKVVREGKNLNFNRNLHILNIEPSANLQPDDTDSLSIYYRGSINEEACYIDIDEEDRAVNFRLFLYNIDKRYSFITPEYVLLTHENLWYPIAGIPYGSAYPEIHSKDFINFELRVKTKSELTALSQGSVSQSDNGEFIFKPEVPMPQISLAIGRYEKRSVTVDDVDYNLFIMVGHDYFSQYFNELGEQLPEIIRESKQDFERKLNMPYPYNRLSLIEVPIQFYCYGRVWTLCEETVQPEQVFLHEKGILLQSADFKRSQYFQSHGMQRRGGTTRTPEEIQSDLFRGFVMRTFSGNFSNRGLMSMRIRATGSTAPLIQRFLSSLMPIYMPSQDIFPNYFSFTNHFNSDDWPIFNIAIEQYLKSQLENQNVQFMRFFAGLSNEETANIALAKFNMSEILDDPDQKDIVYDVLKIKADYLFSMIKSELGNDAFEKFIFEFLADKRFQDTEVSEFIGSLKEQLEFDLESHFDQWYNERRLPAFIITDLKGTEVFDNEKTKYQVVFKVYNPEPVDGIISASLITGGGGPQGMRQFMIPGQGPETIDRYIYIKGEQAKEIGIVLDQPPRRLSINTFISQNLPATFDMGFQTPELDEEAEIFEGERILIQPPRLSEPGEIIKL